MTTAANIELSEKHFETLLHVRNMLKDDDAETLHESIMSILRKLSICVLDKEMYGMFSIDEMYALWTLADFTKNLSDVSSNDFVQFDRFKVKNN